MNKPGQRPWSTRTAKDRHDSATRNALLEAAEELFAERGYKQTTVAHITERAAVSRATFYVYFSSREEVFRALAQRVRDEIAEVQRAASRRSDDPRVIIETSIRPALEIFARKTRLITVIQHQALSDPDVAALWDEIQQGPSRVDAAFIRLLQERHGAEPAASADTVAEVVSAALLHLASVIARDPSRKDELTDELIAIYHRMVGLPAG
jgi:AcrR family transcriptional regulator